MKAKKQAVKKLVYGVGLNDADYKVNTIDESGKSVRCPIYTQWKNMMARCYAESTHKNQPTYRECSVDPRWHSFMGFRDWMIGCDYEGKCLDKDKLVSGNKIYGPDTCLWLTHEENMLFRVIPSNKVYGVYKGFLVDVNLFCGDNRSLYTYVTRELRKDRTRTIESIIEERDYQSTGKRVVWDDVDTALKDLCELYRLNNWDSTVYACLMHTEKPTCSFEMTSGNTGVKYQFKSKLELAEYLGVKIYLVDIYFDDCYGDINTLTTLITNHKPVDRRVLYEIDGVSKYKEDWANHFGTTVDRANESMARYKIPFGDAVQIPIMRIRSVDVDGEVMLVKELWERYGLIPKQCNSVRSRLGGSFTRTLDYFGIDSTGMIIKPL